MASHTNDDGSEDVADFLERIRELGDSQAKEDEERARKLEEEILQGRKERQARRAERARSISPTKDSPLNSSFTAPQQADSPTARSKPEDRMDKSGSELSPTRKQQSARDAPIVEPTKPKPPPSNSSIQRSGTLSWQQRPDMRSSPTIRTRPAATDGRKNEDRSSQDSPGATTFGSQDSSREQAAAMLQGKDPSWFRQTEDRGKQSAAYRKTPDSSVIDSGNVRLHGLGSSSSTGAAASRAPRESSGSRTPSPDRDMISIPDRSSMAISPMPVLSSQRFQPPESPASLGRSPSPSSRSPVASPTLDRTSTEKLDRPSSPTKGLGGFVQSAMMKRSDSVNKRWSGQVAGSKRGSVISPTNSSATEGVIRDASTNDIDLQPAAPAPTKDTNPQTYSNESTELGKESQLEVTQKSTIDFGPSMEAKRWSPSKSSWLEAAINKSEPPKPKAAVPSQPSWMAEINKAKQARLGTTAPNDTAKESTSSRGVDVSSGDGGGRPLSGSKPNTPNATDFRSSLRSRAPTTAGDRSNEPEFKNVFGKLKKTETKNYVAPDELKNNITRGKAALNVTGGPRPYQKKDEFKDSILAKKKEMREGTSVVNTGNVAAAPSTEVPEAIAKRGNMSTRTPGDADAPPPTVPKPKPKPALQPMVLAAENKSTTSAMRSKFPDPLKPKSPPSKRTVVEASAEQDTVRKPSADPATYQKSGDVSKGDSPSSNSTTKVTTSKETFRPSETMSLQASNVTPSRPSSSPSAKRLVDRLNPALASIIARGPPAATETTTSGSQPQASSQKETKAVPKATSAPPLTHTTKARAKGPKRRLPTAAAAGAAANDDTSTMLSGQKDASPSTSSIASKPALSPKAENTISRQNPLAASEEMPQTTQSTAKTLSGGNKIAAPISKAIPNTRDIPTAISSESPVEPSTTASAKSAALETISPIGKSQTPTIDFDKAPQLTKTHSPTGRLQSPTVVSKEQTHVKTDGYKAESSNKSHTKSPPTPGKKPWALARVKSEDAESSVNPKLETAEAKSSVPVSELSSYLSQAFGQPLSTVAGNEYSVDTQSILQRTRDPEKLKTQKKEIWEVTGDGKKISVPAQQEHILFDNSMFLCSHIYEAPNGKRATDVYLWVGREISPSAVEDAQLFCRNAAKEAGGKLLVQNQGKESPALFEALGGIVITRKGTPSSAAGSRYMLCGRRYLGHVAFDEVAFSPDSLFAGFTYIVASIDGTKLFLWKGKGSGTDVVGCARLIAMDLGISGDIEEVEEGTEPASFWKAFGAGTSAREPSTTSTNASWEKYNTRLFAVDVDTRPKSSSGFLGWARRTSTPAPEEDSGIVREIHPFAQSDLSTEGIFVLDAFFELFVIVGSNAFSKLSSLHTAVYFAQEYGVLAASLEDRPFIPSSKVILGGMSESLKPAFRHWDDRKAPTAAQEKVVDLNEVLGAISDAT